MLIVSSAKLDDRSPSLALRLYHCKATENSNYAMLDQSHRHHD